MVDYCAKKNILITAYSAFGNNNIGVPLLVNEPEVKAIAERLSQAQGKTVTAAQVILAWSQIGGHSVIPKSVTPSRIRENFQEVEIDQEAIQALDAMGKNPRRFNIPLTCKLICCLISLFLADSFVDDLKWDINIFNDDSEKDAGRQVILKV